MGSERTLVIRPYVSAFDGADRRFGYYFLQEDAAACGQAIRDRKAYTLAALRGSGDAFMQAVADLTRSWLQAQGAHIFSVLVGLEAITARAADSGDLSIKFERMEEAGEHVHFVFSETGPRGAIEAAVEQMQVAARTGSGVRTHIGEFEARDFGCVREEVAARCGFGEQWLSALAPHVVTDHRSVCIQVTLHDEAATLS
jgi:hypothetical protein